jgi:hypothetical protein
MYTARMNFFYSNTCGLNIQYPLFYFVHSSIEVVFSFSTDKKNFVVFCRMANSLPNGILNRAFEPGSDAELSAYRSGASSDGGGPEPYLREDAADFSSDGETVRMRRNPGRSGIRDSNIR